MFGVPLLLLLCLGCLGSSWAVTNVALNKPATKSTLHPVDGKPRRVLAGNGLMGIRYCRFARGLSRTPRLWWRVGLKKMYDVKSVVITNGGNCCGEPLGNFNIYVTEEAIKPFPKTLPPHTSLCLHYIHCIALGRKVSLPCTRSVTGRYVTLITQGGYYQPKPCKMQVMAVPAKAVNQTTTSPTLEN